MTAFWAFLLAMKQWAAALAALFGFARQIAATIQTESDKASGRAEAEAAQAKAGLAVEEKIAAEAAKPLDETDAIDRLKGGSA